MGKNKNNNRSLPRAKGMDVAAVYPPNECGRKVKRIVLHPANRQIVDEFIAILDRKDDFLAHDVPIPNKVVMFGPPGTGKTLTAFYLAHRLQLPLVLVRLDTIIHSHLGETASNVRKLFEFAASTPCVLFLDEFDAIARTRDNNDEVKEMSRVVNTLLQCLDEFEGDSVFVAATNLEEELDHAVWRRFDTRMTYANPDGASINEYVRLLLDGFSCEEGTGQQAASLFEGCSFADMEQIVLKAKRKAIIADTPLSLEQLKGSFLEYNPKLAGEPGRELEQSR